MPHEQVETAVPSLRHRGEPALVAAPLAAVGEASDQHAHARRMRHLRFVRRVYRLRIIGLALGAIAVASVLARVHAPAWVWLLLALDGIAWPHAAALLAIASRDPKRAELRNLTIDSAFGGIWVAVMQFNLLPSALIATMLVVDKLAVGGVALATRGTLAMVATCAVTAALLGFAFDPHTPLAVVVACMPFLIAYPTAIANAMYALGKRVTRQNRRLEELGRTDALTGLANRGEALDVAARELARHRRSARPATLLIADVDRFKSINDRYGHPRGDEVLCRVAETLYQCCRHADTPGRYGGDEFVVVLPDTTLEGAEELARRIRKTLDAATFERAPGLRCALSIGAAEATPDVASVDEWINRADAALYRAKGGGRDRFEAAPGNAWTR